MEIFSNLEGKTCLVTGANKGIGLKIIETFASKKINLIACCRKKNSDFENTCKLLKNKNKINIDINYFDLQDQEELKTSIEKIKKKFPKIDILINNAGDISTSNFIMTPINKMKELFEINYFSQLFIMQQISKIMISNKQGNIINISSTAGIDANEGRIAYSATKAALINSSKILAKELSKFNIRVNVIAPGLIETDMMKNNTQEQIIKKVTNDLTIKRVGKPDEIANTALFLASELSSYINGQVIRVDGGMI